jgi:hypothetical protein
MTQDNTPRAKLALLAGALIQNIIETPDEEILAEVDYVNIQRARTILIEAKTNVSKRLLTNAQAQLQSWRSTPSRSRPLRDPTAARERFNGVRRAEAAFDQKMTMAARNGREPTESDKEGLIEDFEDLQRLEDRDKSE